MAVHLECSTKLDLWRSILQTLEYHLGFKASFLISKFFWKVFRNSSFKLWIGSNQVFIFRYFYSIGYFFFYVNCIFCFRVYFWLGLCLRFSNISIVINYKLICKKQYKLQSSNFLKAISCPYLSTYSKSKLVERRGSANLSTLRILKISS